LNVKVSYLQGLPCLVAGRSEISQTREKMADSGGGRSAGKERDACVVLAEGYATLAALIEEMNNGCIDRTGGD
jgi:hypothetical protein